MNTAQEEGVKKGSLRLWLIVVGLSVAFLVYGLIFFLAIGDRGAPGWDFGAVSDTPGKSRYSTAQGQSGAPERIERQHVRGGPAPVAGVQKEKRK